MDAPLAPPNRRLPVLSGDEEGHDRITVMALSRRWWIWQVERRGKLVAGGIASSLSMATRAAYRAFAGRELQ